MIDMRTVLISYIVSNAICAGVIGALWFQNRKHFSGLGFWLADYVMQFVALLLSTLRGILPDLVSFVISNALIIGGTILLLVGLERHIGKRGKHVHNVFLLAVFIAVHAYFTIVHPSLEVRNINLSLAILAVCSQGAWLMLGRAAGELRSITRGPGIVFGAYALVSLVRVFVDLAVPGSENFFQSNVYDTTLVMVNQMLFVALTFGLCLMVARRLVMRLEDDILERKRAEAALRSSEEKFFKAFQASPDAILISRMENGRLVEVNDSFCRLSGYTREEALARSTIDLGLWPNLQDREKLVADLRKYQRVRDYEGDFNTKSGATLSTQYSCEVIDLNGEFYVMAIVRDVSERKRYEDALQKQTAALSERIKELKCIGELAGLIETPAITLDEILQKSVKLLPPAMQYPESVGAKLILGNQAYVAGQSRGSDHRLRQDILDGQTVIGSLEVWYSPKIQEKGLLFLEEESNLLYIIAERLGQVIRRMRLDAELRHRTEVLAALHLATLEMVNRLDVDDILQTLLQRTGALLDAPHVSVDLKEGDDLLVTYAVTPGQPLQKGDTMRRGEGGWLSWQAVDAGAPTVLEDYSTWPKRRSIFENFPIHAIMIIPINHREHVIGAINIFRSEVGKSFDETDVYIAQQLAQMVALVLDNARLYAQLQTELSERRQAEEALLVSEQRLRSALKVGQVGYIDWNVQTGEMIWSREACQIFGFDPDTVAPSFDATLQAVLPADREFLQSNLEAAFRGDAPFDVEHRMVRADGEIIHVHSQAELTRDTEGKSLRMLGAVRDITARKQAEEDSLKLAAIEERQRLARDLHDSVSQSIHSLVLLSETLSSVLDKKRPERAREIAGRMQESAHQVLREMRLLLYQLQPSAPAGERDLIRDLEARLVSVERRTGIRADLVLEGSLDDCPRDWMEDLFWITIEALNNSLKYARARNVKVLLRCLPEQVDLEIDDDGQGFDPTRLQVGGLGLRNMYERAAILGGMLEIDSCPGEGACIRFSARKET